MNCKPRIWKFLVLVVAGVAALGWVVMNLWNWLLPSLFTGAHQIGYAQALGLFVLCKILFGGWRHHGPHGWRHRGRWEQMSEEDRRKFKEGMRAFRGWGPGRRPMPGDSTSPGNGNSSGNGA